MLTEAEFNGQIHQEDMQRIKNFRLIDDIFFTKCLDGDIKSVQLILRIVMDKPDLVVISVQIQPFLANLRRRSIRLDVLAIDSDGVKYNIEIQRADKGAGFKRARYHSSMMDANLLKKGKDFNKLPETYVIFITENDVIGDGQPVYHIERYIFESGRIFNDGAHILYVNGAYRGDTPVGKLMHDFFCTDPDDMNYDILADRVRYFKEEKKGGRDYV